MASFVSGTIFQWLFLVAVCLFISNGQQAPTDSEGGKKEKKELSPSRLRAEGDAAFSNREYDKAIKYFNRLIDIEPTKPNNFHKRALTFLVKNSYWKAIRDWGKAINLDDTFTSVLTLFAYLYRGKTYKKLGKCTKSLSDLTKVQSLDANTKDIDALLESAKQCITLHPEAMKLLNAQKCEEAQSVVDSLLEIAPYDVQLNLGLATCNFNKGDFQSVLTYTGNILRIDPQNLEVLLLRGKAYYQMGEKDLALTHFKSGLRSDPEHKAIKKEFKTIKKVWRMLDNAEDEMKRLKWKDALETYAMVLEVDPPNNHLIRFVYINRCKCATRIRNQKRESTCEEGSAEGEGDEGATCEAEVVFEMNNEIRSKYCEEAINHNPDDGDAYFYRGKAFKEMKKWDEAVANFQTAVSKNQGHREYRQELQNAQFEQKKANRKDYYGILGVSQHASPRELKKAFRKCGLEHHPDQNQHKNQEERDYHEAMFKECVEAHDLLSDAEVRAKYDRGEDVLGQQQGGNRGGGPFGGGGFPFGGFRQQGGGGRTFTFKFGG